MGHRDALRHEFNPRAPCNFQKHNMKPSFTIRAEFSVGDHPGGSANPANNEIEENVTVSAETEDEALAEVGACQQCNRIFSVTNEETGITRQIGREESRELTRKR